MKHGHFGVWNIPCHASLKKVCFFVWTRVKSSLQLPFEKQKINPLNRFQTEPGRNVVDDSIVTRKRFSRDKQTRWAIFFDAPLKTYTWSQNDLQPSIPLG